MRTPNTIKVALISLSGVIATAGATVMVAYVGKPKDANTKILASTAQTQPENVKKFHQEPCAEKNSLLKEYFQKLADPTIERSHRVPFAASIYSLCVPKAEIIIMVNDIETQYGVHTIIDYVHEVIDLQTQIDSFKTVLNTGGLIEKIYVYEK